MKNPISPNPTWYYVVFLPSITITTHHITLVILSLSTFHLCHNSPHDPSDTTVGDKIKFPLCTDSPPTCERSCQQKSPKSRPKVASDFRRTLNVIKKVADLFLSGEKIVCARIQFRPKSRACANGTRRSYNFSY